MNEIGKRLKKLRNELELNQGEFAKRLKLAQSMLSAIESGGKPLTDRNMELICLTFRVNKAWLRTGNGKIFEEFNPDLEKELEGLDMLTPDEMELVDIYRQFTEPNKVVARKQIDALLEGQGGAIEKGKTSGASDLEQDGKKVAAG